MHKLLDNTSSGSADGKDEFTTRLVKLEKVDVHRVMPYVQAVLDGVGIGVAQAVVGIGNFGAVLLTTPIGLSHYLDSTIKTNLDNSTLAKFGHLVFYPPAIILQLETNEAGVGGALKIQDMQQVIDHLKLVPPDMKCECVQLDEKRAAIVTSGPLLREKDFTADVLPSLKTLVHGMEKTGFPFS